MKRRDVGLALGLMACGAVAAKAMRPTVHMSELLPKFELEALFPREFGEWQVDPHQAVVLPSPDVQKALNAIYNQVLSRTYVDRQGRRVMLSVAYGGDQSDGTKIHRPENCYPGQGFSITNNHVGAVALVDAAPLPVRRLVATLPGRVEPITYWMMIGEEPTLSSLGNKLAQLRFGIRGYIADGMLIRVSSISRETDEAYGLHDRFIQQLRRAVEPNQRKRVFGS